MGKDYFKQRRDEEAGDMLYIEDLLEHLIGYGSTLPWFDLKFLRKMDDWSRKYEGLSARQMEALHNIEKMFDKEKERNPHPDYPTSQELIEIERRRQAQQEKDFPYEAEDYDTNGYKIEEGMPF